MRLIFLDGFGVPSMPLRGGKLMISGSNREAGTKVYPGPGQLRISVLIFHNGLCGVFAIDEQASLAHSTHSRGRMYPGPRYTSRGTTRR